MSVFREHDSQRAASIYLTSNSPESEQPDPSQRLPLQKQDSCDFGFIDDHQHDEQQEVIHTHIEVNSQSQHHHAQDDNEIHISHPISAAALNFRPSTVLTEKIIAEISDSVRVFRPSRSLHQLVKDRREEEEEVRSGPIHHSSPPPTASIDLVVSGGGLKGYFVCGCVAVLQRQLASNNIHIARVSGASAGAWSGFFVCTGVTTAMWMESYYKCYDNPDRTIHEVYEEEMWPLVSSQLAPDAYLECNGRLFISITTVSSWGTLSNTVVSEFSSNEDLFQACLASSTIPYITERGSCRLFRGMRVIDGGLTNNTPVFRDGTRRQLVFRLSQIEYPWRLLINPVDTCIDALVIRGALQMSRFLAGEGCPAIAWLEEKQGESDLIRPGHTLRRIVAPAAALSLIAFRTSLLPSLFDLLDQAYATSSLVHSTLSVNFSEADSVFQTHPLFYALGTAFAALVSVMRRMHLLL